MRPATPADVESIVNLIQTAYRGEGSRAGWTTEVDLLDGQRTDAAEVRASIAEDHSQVIVLEADEEIIGCCHVRRLPDGDAYFGMFAVRPDLQGRGTGRTLLEEAERIAKDEWQCTRLCMSVIKQRAELIAWYERLGYRRTGEFKPFPYGDERFGIPKLSNLEFLQLSKQLSEL